MSVIQKLYPLAERELKDYIAKPKPNGYQSLHATQLVPDLTTNGAPVAVEFQVKSVRRDMLMYEGTFARNHNAATGERGYHNRCADAIRGRVDMGILVSVWWWCAYDGGVDADADCDT